MSEVKVWTCVENLTRDLENNRLYLLLIFTSKYFDFSQKTLMMLIAHLCIAAFPVGDRGLPLLAVSFSVLWWINAAVKVVTLWSSRHLIYYLLGSSIKESVFLPPGFLMICRGTPRTVTTQPLTSAANTGCFSHLCIAAFRGKKSRGEKGLFALWESIFLKNQLY